MTEYYKSYTIIIEDVGKVKIEGISLSFLTVPSAKEYIDNLRINLAPNPHFDKTIGNLY